MNNFDVPDPREDQPDTQQPAAAQNAPQAEPQFAQQPAAGAAPQWPINPSTGQPLKPGEQIQSQMSPQQRSADANAAASGQTNSSGAPARVLAGAKQVALLGGPGAVARWMAQQGFPQHSAWCGDFAASVMRSQGLPVPRNPSIASNWRNWGRRVAVPRPGDVAVRRGAPTGGTGSHVTIVRALSPDGRYMLVTGGNQRGGMTEWMPTSNYSFHSMRYTPGVDENSTLYAHGLGM